MERRAAARLEDPGTPSETESEDEPILYRDTLPDQGMITPPSGFASPTGDRNPPNLVSFYFNCTEVENFLHEDENLF